LSQPLETNAVDLAPPEGKLSEADFRKLGALIEKTCGIRMPPGKQIMLEGRLRKRVRALGLRGYSEYCRFVLEGENPDEVLRMVDEVTTNKTDFFREAKHFEYLTTSVLPTLGCGVTGGRNELKVWSAGCSSGEEPYTLAMVLTEATRGMPGFRFEITATDISTDILQQAASATYTAENIEPIPMALRQKYLLRKKDGSEVFRIGSELRQKVSFDRLNLLDRSFMRVGKQDVIFCRNVFIYFEKNIQAQILERFCETLAPDGFIFLGHSETISGLSVPLVQVAPTVYRKARVGGLR
jgi:chemotaxis protein methyltransferase CheR